MRKIIVVRSGGPENLQLVEEEVPEPGPGEVRVKVLTAGVAFGDLLWMSGVVPGSPKPPFSPGYDFVGVVDKLGEGVKDFAVGQRVAALVRTGGYAEYMVVPETSAYPIPAFFSDSEAAPLLCAGAIGYRSLRLSELNDGQQLGLTGFGGSGHLVLKMARHRYPKTDIFVFARSQREREFARELGAVWAGDTADVAPVKLDAIIDTTPVWKPVVEALENLAPGGRLIINAIRKEEFDKRYLLKLDYPTHLWLEKEIKSVANVARRDVQEFLALASQMKIKPEYQEYKLEEANQALVELRSRKIRGAKVLVL